MNHHSARVKQIKTSDILSFFFSNNAFSFSSKKKNYFKKTTKEYKKLKKIICSLFPELSDKILFPYNDFLSIITIKDCWSLDEIKKIDEQFSVFLKKKLFKDIGQFL